MKARRTLWASFVAAFVAIITVPAAAQESCAHLAKQKYPNVIMRKRT
jgi:hypothetical protein